jgi:hypothetical protein
LLQYGVYVRMLSLHYHSQVQVDSQQVLAEVSTKLAEVSTKLVEVSPELADEFLCKYCEKEYKHKSSLSKHKYSCFKG